jgi:chromosome partitioning protein
MTRVYALANQKGGVGKTTTAINLAAYLAQLEQRVLVVDLDPQSNATSSLGMDKNKVTGGVYDALVNGAAAAEFVLHSPQLRLALLPASPALAGAEVELVNALAREVQLKRALDGLQAHYDYVLIDCPPSLGLLTLNGLVAAHDGVIIPVQCEYLALEGLGQLTNTITRVRAVLNPRLVIRGLVMTMFDRRASLAAQVVAEVSRHFPGKVFEAIIPRSVRLAEAPSHGLPISVYAPGSAGGTAYRALAEELLEADRAAAGQAHGPGQGKDPAPTIGTPAGP